MSTGDDWAKAYARQAAADFSTYLHLRQQKIPECHKLHFLQMACEKLCKAHLCKGGTNPKTLQRSHGYVAGTLPVVLMQELVLSRIAAHDRAWIMGHVNALAKEIDVLAPAVQRGGTRPDNCEYPWEGPKGNLICPIDWSFKAPTLLQKGNVAQRFRDLVLKAIARLQ
jgi:hypothetical protein